MEETRVMVVDDEAIVCDRLKDHLEKNDLRVTTFTDSREALAALDEGRYHVVVTDLKMAGATGLDVLHNIRQRGHPTQVIIITGYASMEAAREAEAVGAYDFVCKPFELKDLTRKVKKAAKRARRGVGLPPPKVSGAVRARRRRSSSWTTSPSSAIASSRLSRSAGTTWRRRPTARRPSTSWRETRYDVLITDLKMSGPSGLDVLRFVKEHSPSTRVIVITGYATAEQAKESIKGGAVDFIAKPFRISQLRELIARTLES